jgi:hypothetical protein
MSPFFIRGMGGAYGERKMFDFFVRHLQGANPPEWNKGKAARDRPRQDV